MDTQLPLVSFCIPTYNRSTYLRRCLDTILTQEGFSDSNIEIIISDNASNDDTSLVAEEYGNAHGNIHYYRNDENIGANRNLFVAAERARGKYIWFMGDDDLIGEGGLLKILNILHKNDSIVLVHTNMIDHNMEKSIDDGVGYWKDLIKNRKSYQLSVFLLFLSMVIIRRQDFMKHLSSFRSLYPHKLGDSFSHFHVLIRCIFQQKIFLIDNIVIGGDDFRGSHDYFKNNSSKWYSTVITNGIDKIGEDLEYLHSIGIDKLILFQYRKSFVRIYRLMWLGDILRYTGLYTVFLKAFRIFLRKHI